MNDDAPPTTRSRLVRDLRALGVRRGAALMVHARMSSIGWIPGGADTVVEALLEAVDRDAGGTLLAICSWEHHCYDLDRWPPARRAAYLAEPPAFDAATSTADPGMGRMPERLRTWPGARASRHPLARFVAVGARADALVEDHPWSPMFGPGSPLDRLVQADGQVLLLGAPLETTTLLHLAEVVADVREPPDGPGKRRARYRMPLRSEDPAEGPVVWREFDDVESGSDVDDEAAALPYADVVDGDEDPFARIVGDALRDGVGRTGLVGAATCRLFEAPALLAYGVRWIEDRFGPGASRAPVTS